MRTLNSKDNIDVSLSNITLVVDVRSCEANTAKSTIMVRPQCTIHLSTFLRLIPQS